MNGLKWQHDGSGGNNNSSYYNLIFIPLNTKGFALVYFIGKFDRFWGKTRWKVIKIYIKRRKKIIKKEN